MEILGDNCGTKISSSDVNVGNFCQGDVSVKQSRSRLMYPQLIPHVKQYLEASVKKCGAKGLHAISIDQMASSLQCRHVDYARKRRSQFKMEVDKAYRIVMQSEEFQMTPDIVNSVESNGKKAKRRRVSERASNESPLNTGQPDYKGGNMMNEMLRRMYKSAQIQSPASSDMRQLAGAIQNNGVQQVPDGLNASSRDIFRDGFTIDRTPSLIAQSAPVPPAGGTRSADDVNSIRVDEICEISPDDCVIIDDRKTAGSVSVEEKESRGDSAASVGSREERTLPCGSTAEAANVHRTPTKADVNGPTDSEEGRAKSKSKESLRKRKRIAEVASEDEQIARKSSKSVDFQKASVTLADVGGLSERLREEIEDLVLPLRDPTMMELNAALGIIPSAGILLHGPSGCGKTLLAEALAGEFDLPFLPLTPTSIVSGISGESEENVSNIFKEAEERAPCVLFFEEIDAIAPKKDSNSRMMEQRIASEIASCMTNLRRRSGVSVLVLGATSRLDAVHPALRCTGRFDKEIDLGIPTSDARMSILKVLCRGARLESDFDFQRIARLTPGYVGSDLSSLTDAAKKLARKRLYLERRQTEGRTRRNELEPTGAGFSGVAVPSNESGVVDATAMQSLDSNSNQVVPIADVVGDNASSLVSEKDNIFMTMADFERAIACTQPALLRDGFMTISDVKWSDIGALDAVKRELRLNIMGTVKHPEAAARHGMSRPYSVLLVGPPGCGKTMVAKAIANEAGLNFILVNGPELINKYVGESERGVRQVFEKARNCAPCVIFFDEVDSICPNRSSDHGEGNSASRVVNQLLAVMDGAQQRKKVFVIGATNRPDTMDPALLRPGRFSKMLYVGLPDAPERYEILRAITKNGTTPALADDVDLFRLANDERCNGLTGADLMALISAVSVRAFSNFLEREPSSDEVELVTWKYFDEALGLLKPSVNGADRLRYARLKESIESKPTTLPSTLDY